MAENKQPIPRGQLVGEFLAVISAGLAAAIFLPVYSPAGAIAASSAGEVTISELPIDVGAGSSTDSKVFSFTIHNDGRETVVLTGKGTSCSCIEFKQVPDRIESGQSVSVSFVFHFGRCKIGTFSKDFVFYLGNSQQYHLVGEIVGERL